MLNNNTLLKKNKSAGFTLIEILTAMTIFTVMVAIGADFIIISYKATTFEAEQETAVRGARDAMDIITKEIRGANSSEQGDYPLAIVDDNNLVFYSDTDDDGQMEKISYYLDGSQLLKSITEPGAANDYSGAGATTTIASYVNNQEQPIFIYFDNNHNNTDIINQIRLIQITLLINVTPARAPNDYSLETAVNLRNLKDNL